MNNPYTPEDLQGKFVVYSKQLSEKIPAFECVIQTAGPHAGLPYLYNSIEEAYLDKYFDKHWDQVIPAEEYFELLNKKIAEFKNS
jgi:hypothetical protein